MQGNSASKRILFTDLRHIRCGDLDWLSPDGDRLPVVNPPEPAVEARARMRYLPRGIRLAAQPATKIGPLESRPPGRVIYADGLYRSWGLVAEVHPGAAAAVYYTNPPAGVTVRYAESQDGLEWRTVSDFPLDAPGLTGVDGPHFFIDPHGPADERYKIVFAARPPVHEQVAHWEAYQKVHPRYRDVRINLHNLHCIYAAVSPDGLHWRVLPQPLMVHQGDTDNTIYWDEWLGRYVMYTRLYWQERRWIGRAETEDFHRWGPVEPLLWPNLSSLTDDLYLNARTEYPGLPQYHLMFPLIYQRFTQASEVHLYSSADGICWNQVPGGPVISPGEQGSWDSEFIYVGRDLVPMGNDRIGMTYHGTPYPHKYPSWPHVLETHRNGWVWWPRGRLCGVVADEEGEFFTTALVPAGRELRLNFRTHRGGCVQVEVIHSGQVVPGRTLIDCDSLYGDGLSVPVHWQGQTDIGTPEGEAVTLHFKLRAAELFGLEWV